MTRDNNTLIYVSIHATLAGGDQCGSVLVCQPEMFLSTPPSRVATWHWDTSGLPLKCFYPRHPRGWRPKRCQRQCDLYDVSIHATLAGGDKLFG